MLPISIVENHAFKDYIELLDPLVTMPTRGFLGLIHRLIFGLMIRLDHLMVILLKGLVVIGS